MGDPAFVFGHLRDKGACFLTDRLAGHALTGSHYHVNDQSRISVDDCVAVHLKVACRPLFVEHEQVRSSSPNSVTTAESSALQADDPTLLGHDRRAVASGSVARVVGGFTLDGHETAAVIFVGHCVDC